MKNILILFLICAALAACTPAPGGGQVYNTTIDGIPHMVQKMPGTEEGWAASKSDVSGGFINPKDCERNVRAIEKVTQCKVVRETISNGGMLTRASVNCHR